MSHDDQLMMNQAQPLIPDDGHDEEVDPADLAPCISGNTPIITIPASEDEEVAGEVTADGAEEVIQEMQSRVYQG